MAQAREETNGFTVTFRSLVLQAFKGGAEAAVQFPRVRRVAPALRVASGPLGERVRTAFTELPPNQTEARVLGALLRRPGATSAELSRLCGWRQPIWHTHFGLLCRRRAAWLWPSDPAAAPDAAFLSGVLADYRPKRRIFSFKPEVATALRGLPVDFSA